MGRTSPNNIPTRDRYSITAEKHDFDGRKAALKELGVTAAFNLCELNPQKHE